MGSRLRRLLGPALVVVLLAGCSSEGEARTDATATPSTSRSATSTGSPAAGPTPSVTPATGRAYALPALSLTLPRHYRQLGRGTGNGLLSVTQYATRDSNGFLSIGALANLASGDLDDAAALALKDTDQTPTRLPDREVGAQQVYAVRGSSADTALFYSVGRIVDDRIVDLTFSYRADEGTDQQEIDSILATVRWTDQR